MRLINKAKIECIHSFGRRHRLLAVLGVLSLMYAGCIPVPLPWKAEEPRVSEQEIKPFTLGISTRKDVEAALGKPDLTRRSNQLWIYSWTRHHGKAFALFVFPIVFPFPHLAPLYESYHVLFIDFDTNGVVQGIDLASGDDPCRQDGVCVRGWKSREGVDYSWRLDDSETIITASYSEDDDAKHFIPCEGTCGVYLYAAKETIHLSFAGLVNRPLDNESYVFCELTPGMKTLHPYSGPSARIWASMITKFDCPGGKNVYLRVSSAPGWTVSLETPAVGQERIMGKRLQLLDCPQPVEPSNFNLIPIQGMK